MDKSLKGGYNHTIRASFVGYIVQAIVNNFAPLLFITFQTSYQISLEKISLLISINFGIQLVVDLLSVKFVDKIGYRTSIVIAHVASALGLMGLGIFPELFSDPFNGLLLAVAIYAVGGGLIEVLISPIVESCPTTKKEATMSLLHSFYCWGHVMVVLFSTLFFTFAGIRNWKIMAFLWAIIPIANGIAFLRVPLSSIHAEGEKGLKVRELLQKKTFWVMMLLMVCAGACEQAVSQWASAFAELGLGVSKTVGDLAGPLSFAVFMGGARVFYAKFSEKIDLRVFMLYSGFLCLGSYLLTALSPFPVFGLIGCALCGLSVGILWPGTFSLAVKGIPRGGTAMFAFFALAGDVGCATGPAVVGIVSDAVGFNLKLGILAAIVFPILLILGLLLAKEKKQAKT